MATSDSVSVATKATVADNVPDGSALLRSRRRECFRVVTDELADALGVASLTEIAGCWDHAVDARWAVSVNAHATEMQSKLLQLPVPPGHVVAKYNGWLAGLVDASGTGEFGLGGGVDEEAFIAAVRAAIRAIERERFEKKSTAATSSTTDEKRKGSTDAVASSHTADLEGLWRTRTAEGEITEAVHCAEGLPYDDADERSAAAAATTTDTCPGPHTCRVKRRPCLGAECVALVCYVCANRSVFAPPYCGAECQPACDHERKPCEGPECRQTACADCDASRYCSWRCADNAFDAVA